VIWTTEAEGLRGLTLMSVLPNIARGRWSGEVSFLLCVIIGLEVCLVLAAPASYLLVPAAGIYSTCIQLNSRHSNTHGM